MLEAKYTAVGVNSYRRTNLALIFRHFLNLQGVGIILLFTALQSTEMAIMDDVFRCRCGWMLGADLQLIPLSDVERRGLNSEVIDSMASVGLRTIAIAFRDIVPGTNARVSV
jgi:hypothetical protein